MNISPARVAAFRILKKIELEGGLSAVLLPEAEGFLDGADKGLCHALVLGALRRQIYLDRLIDSAAGGKKIDRDIRMILRLGIFQLKFLERVPPHAAINESVELAKFARKHSAAGFVNAILRKLSRETPHLEFASEIERLSVETSHPAELIERWSSQFGAERAAKISRANNELPSIAFRRTPKTNDPLIESLIVAGEAERSKLVAGAFISVETKARLRELEADGRIYFQDEASQLVAEIASGFVRSRFLDLCAAPGSKTAAIAMSVPTARITAGDFSAKRTKTLVELLQRQGIEDVEVLRYDAEKPLPFDAIFDTILLDAPCSGTGTIRHNPEIRYRVKVDELERLQARQLVMLRNAAECLIPGGHLIYSTCSLEREENEDVIAEFLGGSDAFEIGRINGREPLIRDDGTLRTYPDRDGVDGFFAAVLRRKT
ncbi:MAG TPA: 16S rRNA (cytosine(967)-C(5))-methyltransferase RsmB [Pyrinomonadaceae bacterium]|nr:16S rRNA (cytosine(967)-C(5))-methyltransferase RsmB [Pyrinomonadaceae bacterium]